jgi:hypothetical protein
MLLSAAIWGCFIKIVNFFWQLTYSWIKLLLVQSEVNSRAIILKTEPVQFSRKFALTICFSTLANWSFCVWMLSSPNLYWTLSYDRSRLLLTVFKIWLSESCFWNNVIFYISLDWYFCAFLPILKYFWRIA